MNLITKKNICFVFIRGDLASSKVRGKQIAHNLNLPCFKFSLEKALNYKIIIYVKLLPTVKEMEILNRKNIIQIVDLLDNYNEKNIIKRLKFINFFIAASITHKAWIYKRYFKKTYLIPHHHFNATNKKNTIKKKGPLNIGYVGDKKFWKFNKFIQRFKEHTIIKDINFNNLHQVYSSLDVATAARKDSNKLSLNSNLKLLNYMSYGIPCVASPESSFLEIARHGKECLYAQNDKEFLLFTDLLLNDYKLRKEISCNAHKVAKNFTKANVIKIYKKFLLNI